MVRNRLPRRADPATIFWFASLGAYALLAQTALLRQFLVSFGGNELALGLFFAAWFAGIGLGALWVARRVDRLAHRWPVVAFLAPAVAMPTILLTALKLLPTIIHGPSGVLLDWRVSLAGAFLVLPQGVAVGVLFPWMVAREPTQTDRLTRLFVWEAIGAAAAGALFSVFLAQTIVPLATCFLAAAWLAVGAAWAVSDRLWRQMTALLVFAVVLAAGFGVINRGEQALEKRRFDSMRTGAAFVETLQTRYQHVVLSRLGNQVQIYGNGMLLDTYPDPHRDRLNAALLLALQTGSRRVALLDGGLTGLGAQLADSSLVQHVAMVYLDQRLVAAIRQDMPLFAGGEVIRRDPRPWVREQNAAWDLLVVLAPDPANAQINRLYTHEFFTAARRALRPDGLMVLSATGAAQVLGDEIGPYMAGLYRTLQAVFPHVTALPGDQVWFIAGERLPPVADLTALQANYRQAYADRPPMPPEVLTLLFEPERQRRFLTALKARPVRINRDLHPISHLAFLRVWDRFTGGALASWFAWLAASRPMMWVVGWLMLCLIVAGLAGWRGRYPLTAVATSGFGSMGLVLVLTMALQSLIGTMYAWVALLVALYMGGLALGGAAARWCREPTRALRRTDLLLAAVALLTALVLPRLTDQAAWLQSVVLFTLLLAAGFTAGPAFPLAATALAQQREAVGRRAGRVDAADHLAAMVGAGAVGLVLVPKLGLPAVCAMVALLKVSSWLGGWAAGRRTVGKQG